MKSRLPYVREWLRKAQADRIAAKRAFQDSRRIPDQAEIACFHAQQCAEKYLKAVLAMAGKLPPKIHDLIALAGQIKRAGFNLTRLEDSLRHLNGYAVEIRYPGYRATRAEARLVLRKMEEVAVMCGKIFVVPS